MRCDDQAYKLWWEMDTSDVMRRAWSGYGGNQGEGEVGWQIKQQQRIARRDIESEGER